MLGNIFSFLFLIAN